MTTDPDVNARVDAIVKAINIMPDEAKAKYGSKFDFVYMAPAQEFVKHLAKLRKAGSLSEDVLTDLVELRKLMTVEMRAIENHPSYNLPHLAYRNDETALRKLLTVALEMLNLAVKEDPIAIQVKKVVDDVSKAIEALPKDPNSGFEFLVKQKTKQVTEQVGVRVQANEFSKDIATHMIAVKILLEKKPMLKTRLMHRVMKGERQALEALLHAVIAQKEAAKKKSEQELTRAAGITAMPAKRIAELVSLRDEVVKELQEISDDELNLVRALTSIEAKELKWLQKINVVHKVGQAGDKVHVSELVAKIEKAQIKEEEIKNEPDLQLRYIKYLALTILHVHTQTEKLQERIVLLKKVIDTEYAKLNLVIHPKRASQKEPQDEETLAEWMIDCANENVHAIEQEYEQLKRMFTYTKELRNWLSKLEEAQAQEGAETGYHLVLSEYSKKKSHLPQVQVVETLQDGTTKYSRVEAEDINLDRFDRKFIDFGKIDDPDVDVFLPNGHIASEMYGYTHARIEKETLVLDDYDSDGGTFVRRGDTVYWVVGQHLDNKRSQHILDRVGVEYDAHALLSQQGIKLVDVAKIQLQQGDLVEFGNTAHYIFRVEAHGKVRKLKKIPPQMVIFADDRKESKIVVSDDGYHLVLDTKAQVPPPQFTIVTMLPDGSEGYEKVTSEDVHLEKVSAKSSGISFGRHPVLSQVTLQDPELSFTHAVIDRDTLTLTDNDSDTGTFVLRNKKAYWVVGKKFDLAKKEAALQKMAVKEGKLLFAFGTQVLELEPQLVSELQLQPDDRVEFGYPGKYVFRFEKRGRARSVKKIKPVEYEQREAVLSAKNVAKNILDLEKENSELEKDTYTTFQEILSNPVVNHGTLLECARKIQTYLDKNPPNVTDERELAAQKKEAVEWLIYDFLLTKRAENNKIASVYAAFFKDRESEYKDLLASLKFDDDVTVLSNEYWYRQMIGTLVPPPQRLMTRLGIFNVIQKNYFTFMHKKDDQPAEVFEEMKAFVRALPALIRELKPIHVSYDGGANIQVKVPSTLWGLLSHPHSMVIHHRGKELNKAIADAVARTFSKTKASVEPNKRVPAGFDIGNAKLMIGYSHSRLVAKAISKKIFYEWQTNLLDLRDDEFADWLLAYASKVSLWPIDELLHELNYA